MRPLKLLEKVKDFEQRRTQMRDEFRASSSKDQIQQYVKIKPKLPPSQPVLHQISPLRECHDTEAQTANADIQPMIRVLHAFEHPPNQANFTIMFFQKLHKNKLRLEVVNELM